MRSTDNEIAGPFVEAWACETFVNIVENTKNEWGLVNVEALERLKYNVYDMKYMSDANISYNPALGTGQIQIKDIHYVSIQKRTAWEFCQMMDKKYLASTKRSYESWLELANKYAWIK